MLPIAIAVWVLLGIAFAFLGRFIAAGFIGLPSFLVFGISGSIAGGWFAAQFADLLGGALLGAVLGALVGVSLVAAIAEGRTKGPT